jgi:indolepyruvate ferredoxin oxidoreductase, beta subunit
MNAMDIYLTGVGGQGIGLISEILLRAADHAQLKVKAVDTHGLAQRGGIVVSHLRIGETINAPLIREGKADLVIALERHEALRGAQTFLKQGGTLVYYNVVWQPLDVRLNIANEIKPDDISLFCKKNNIKEFQIFVKNLDEPRMQNIALLHCINHQNLLPGVEKKHYKMSMSDLLTGTMLEDNLKLFESGDIVIN